MKRVADLLCILTMFSIRADFHEKALRYSRTGYSLFPEDIRFLELYAYALILSEDYSTADQILANAKGSTCNTALLQSRVAVMLGLSKDEKRSRITRFLNYWSMAG